MKRLRASGASYRKKRIARQEENRKAEGSILRYIGNTARDDSRHHEVSAPHDTHNSNAFDEADEDPNTVVSNSKIAEGQTSARPASPTGADASSIFGKEDFEPDVPDQGSSSNPTHQEEICGSTAMSDNTDSGLWPDKIPDSLRISLIKLGPEVARHLDSEFAAVARPGDSARGLLRYLTRDWFFKTLQNGETVLRTWMLYSPSKAAIFCFCCKLFKGETSPKSAFSSKEGFKKWWKPNPEIQQHESSPAHVDSFTEWKSLEMRIERRGTIDDSAQAAMRNEEKKWRDLLHRFFDIVRFLAKQNLALRGHRETFHDEDVANRGNFLELVQVMARYDPVLSEHFTKVKLGRKNEISYMSPLIQNQIIDVLGSSVRRELIEQVKNAKYFCMIFDSTPDCSHQDQISQVLRYVKIDGSRVSVVESFIDFIESKGKKAEDIANLILQKIERDGLDIQDCRGQAYDNASVMAGKDNGVQAKIRAINPEAQFVACANHSLNLVGVHAATESIGSVTFFNILDEIFKYFSSSTGRWSKLTSATSHGVKRSIETRWSARHDAVDMIVNHLMKILEVLEELTDNQENAATRSGAEQLLQAMYNFSFLCYLNFWSAILRELNDAQKYLQAKDLDIHKSAVKIRALSQWLICNRDDLVSESFLFAERICDELGIDFPKPRRSIRGRELHATPRDADVPFEEVMRKEINSCLDRVLQEITSRFQQLRDLDEKFGPLKPATLLDDTVPCDLTHAPCDIDREDFLRERTRLQEYIKACPERDRVVILNEGPLGLLQFIRSYSLDISVPNIVIWLRIFLTVAISSAGCGRSFSKLKLIKNYLRSSMSQLRLSNLAIISIEHDTANQLDMEDAINEFAILKARKVNL